MKAYLILEDGSVITGEHHGDTADVYCEVVFNTSMTGYQEILTDPTYKGQGVILTYPLIGNYGINQRFSESKQAHASALICHEISDIDSHFETQGKLDDYLAKHHIFALTDIDTRALTRKIRTHGTMKGYLTCTNLTFNDIDFTKAIDEDLVAQVTTPTTNHYLGTKGRIALLDLGCKASIIDFLCEQGYDVTIYNAYTSATTILEGNYDGIIISNGPGNPKAYEAILNELRTLNATSLPILALGLGHQMMALVNGMDTYKLTYGHRGTNQPVMDEKYQRVHLTTQNHGYVVDEKAINHDICEPRFVNINDRTCEGFTYTNRPMLSLQFYPDTKLGGVNTSYLYEEFFKMMEDAKNA